MIRAFVLGWWERDCDMTTHFEYPAIEWYDRGRNIGRWLLGEAWGD